MTANKSVAIEVEHLSKQYVVGRNHSAAETFREAVTRVFTNPFRNFARGQALGEREKFWALKDVSFEIARGEVVGIIGRNGAGKSTLLKILSRITDPTAGLVRIRGRVASLLEVGTGFHAELTGRENIYLNGAILGISRSDVRRQFDDIVAFAEIEKFIDTPVKRYSSGMYLRLAFAVASHLEPDILFVDEVLAVGDASFQAKCLNRLSDVGKAGRTILFVSHNLGAIQELCTSAILFEHGRVAFIGAPANAIMQYTSSFKNPAAATLPVSGPLADDLEIRKLDVLQDGEFKVVLSSKKPTAIRVLGVVSRAFRDLDLAIGIFRNGIRLFSCFDAPPGTGIRAGPFTAEYLLPKYVFRPGRYAISFGARRNDGADWLWAPDIYCFDVAEEWDAVVRQRDEGVALVTYESQRIQNEAHGRSAIGRTPAA